MKAQTKKEIIRVFFSFLVSLAVVHFVEFSPAVNVLMFLAIYVIVSLIIEQIIKFYHKRKNKNLK